MFIICRRYCLLIEMCMSPRLLNHFEQLDIGLLRGCFDKIVQFILHFPHGVELQCDNS
jgi:hypothetical protein